MYLTEHLYQEYVKLSEFKNKEINLKAENTVLMKIEHNWNTRENASGSDTLEDSLPAPYKVKHTLTGIFLTKT